LPHVSQSAGGIADDDAKRSRITAGPLDKAFMEHSVESAILSVATDKISLKAIRLDVEVRERRYAYHCRETVGF